MIKIENAEVIGWKHAVRGMRNPMNSWSKSDSKTTVTIPMGDEIYDLNEEFVVGPNDHKLMMQLRAAGTDHRKFMRMIICYADITAPLYWWKEADTYRAGLEKNSCSTMHKIAEKEFTMDDFSHEHLLDDAFFTSGEYVESYTELIGDVIACLNYARTMFLETKDKKWWWQMIQLLPTSYNQKRTVMMSYEALANMYHARKNHKLDEWKNFCKWIESLPYSELITGEAGNEN